MAGIFELCARCGQAMAASIVSRFNTDVICLSCEAKEKQHPGYRDAVNAEEVALRSGNRNFPGIGKPNDL